MAENRINQSKEIEFAKWLMIKRNKDIELGTVSMLTPIKEHLPNLENFVKWFYEIGNADIDDAFLKSYITIVEQIIKGDYDWNELQNIFIDEIEKKVFDYSKIEQAVYFKIVLSWLIENWNYSDISVIFIELQTYFKYRLLSLENDLPFKIKDKEIMVLDDSNPNVKWYIEWEKDTTATQMDKPIINSINNPNRKKMKPIQLDLEQRQIIYLFQKLIDEKLLNETKNPTIWDLVARYFTDKDNNPLKNIHQNKDGLKNTKTGKPNKNATEIENIVNEVKAQK
ncbi:MAG: hypothetical protein LC107_07090 [Chitinophagales bacterium]|nr:hypothetical protein [Chitinophagales bacterium]